MQLSPPPKTTLAHIHLTELTPDHRIDLVGGCGRVGLHPRRKDLAAGRDLVDRRRLVGDVVGRGIMLYMMSLRYLVRLGVTAAEIHTMVWFAMTIIGVVDVQRPILQLAAPGAGRRGARC